MENMRKVRVTLGLCKPDHTWHEAVVELDAPEDLEELGTDENFGGFDLRNQSFEEWCFQSIPKDEKDTPNERAKRFSNAIGAYSGFFVLHWDWADEDDE